MRWLYYNLPQVYDVLLKIRVEYYITIGNSKKAWEIWQEPKRLGKRHNND